MLPTERDQRRRGVRRAGRPRPRGLSLRHLAAALRQPQGRGAPRCHQGRGGAPGPRREQHADRRRRPVARGRECARGAWLHRRAGPEQSAGGDQPAPGETGHRCPQDGRARRPGPQGRGAPEAGAGPGPLWGPGRRRARSGHRVPCGSTACRQAGS